jgi:hypothetical protein
MSRTGCHTSTNNQSCPAGVDVGKATRTRRAQTKGKAMGIDVNLYAEGHVTDEQLEEASAYMLARCSIADTFSGQFSVLERNDSYDRPRVVLSTMSRYYGPAYERGDWPSIYGAIRLMQKALHPLPVFYGGDSSEDGEECTQEFLHAMWSHFLGPHGDDYRVEVRAWNAAHAKGTS